MITKSRFISDLPPHHRYRHLPSVHWLLSVPLSNTFINKRSYTRPRWKNQYMLHNNNEDKTLKKAHLITFISWLSEGSRWSIFTLKDREYNIGWELKPSLSPHNNKPNKPKTHTGYPATPCGPDRPLGPWFPTGPCRPVSPHWPMFPCGPFRRLHLQMFHHY